MFKENVNLNNSTILVTGAAGFIGANLVLRLLKEIENSFIIGLDNLNDYYDPAIKDFRLKEIEKAESSNKWVFVKGNLADKELIEKIFAKYSPKVFLYTSFLYATSSALSNVASYTVNETNFGAKNPFFLLKPWKSSYMNERVS